MMSSLPFPCLEALEPRLAPAGIVAVNVKGGVLTLTGGEDSNDVEIYDAGDGLWGIRDGADSGTTFSLNGAAAQAEVAVSVSGGVKIALHGGDDVMTFNGVTISGPVTLNDTAGDDIVNFNNTVVQGVIKLNTGIGNDTVNAIGSSFNDTLSIKAGEGDDRVILTRGTYGDITAELGTGANDFELMDSEVGAAISVFGDVSVTSKGTADSQDYIYLGAENFLIMGNLKVKGGLSNSLFSLSETGNQSHALITGNLSYQSGNGSPYSDIALGSSITIGGKADFKINKGDGSLSAHGVNLTLGSLSYTGSKGGNYLDFDGQSVTIAGDAVFKMSASQFDNENYVNFESEVNVSIGGDLTYQGGKSANGLYVNTANLQVLGELSFTAGAGTYNQVRIDCATGVLGSVVYKGGAGEDEMFIGEGGAENLHILGRMDVNLGKIARNLLFLNDTTLHGAVSINAGTNQPANDVAPVTIVIGDSTFLSSVTIKTSGSQGAEIGFVNSTFLDAVSLTTGAGDDRIYLDSGDYDFANAPAKNLFEGPVKILLGGGDDVLSMGTFDGEEDQGNTFNNSVLLDGGTGENVAFYTPGYGNTFNGTLTENNFVV